MTIAFGRDVEVNGRETGGWREVIGQDDGEEEGKVGSSPDENGQGKTGGKARTGDRGGEEEVGRSGQRRGCAEEVGNGRR